MVFHIGFAISAYQTEGNNHNSDWYYYEKKKLLPESGNCCNLWEKYEKIINILLDLNVNSFRFSIEWSRIYPSKDKIDYSSLRRYIRFIVKLKENNIIPFVTFWHFTNPKWFHDLGGWKYKENIVYFLEYVELLAKNLKDLVKFYIIVNEPLVYSLSGYFWSTWPPFEKVEKFEDTKLFLDVYENIKIAAKEANKILKEVDNNNFTIYTENVSDISKVIPFIGSDVMKILINSYPNEIDGIGINYYGYAESLSDVRNRNFKMSLKIYEKILRRLHKKYNKPIFITEVGINTEDEYERVSKLKNIILYTFKVRKKYDIKGLFIWSLCDNYEWDIGYNAHFGILTRDLKEKDSYYELKEFLLKIKQKNI